MKKISLFFLFWVLLCFNSCRVLTESQIKNINAFGTSAKSYSHYPSEVVKKRAVLVIEEKLISTIALPSPDQIKDNIAQIQKAYKSQIQKADSLDLALQLIQQYASLLSKLSSDNFVENLQDNTNELNENLGDLVKIANAKLPNKIPTDVSSAISKAIFLIGERLTKNKQAKALKEFIPKGDILIKVTVKNIAEAFDIHELLADDKAKFIRTYTNIIFADTNRINYHTLSQYESALNNYDRLEQLRKECIEATNKLAIAHSKLNGSILAKTDFKEIFKETQDLIISVQGLYKTFSQLSFNK